jgi:hypothetical protein
MRTLTAALIVAATAVIGSPAKASVICVVDTPDQRPLAALERPDGRVLSIVEHGEPVEIIAMGTGLDQTTPWAEIGPVGRTWDGFGWVVRWAVICGPR